MREARWLCETSTIQKHQNVSNRTRLYMLARPSMLRSTYGIVRMSNSVNRLNKYGKRVVWNLNPDEQYFVKIIKKDYTDIKVMGIRCKKGCRLELSFTISIVDKQWLFCGGRSTIMIVVYMDYPNWSIFSTYSYTMILTTKYNYGIEFNEMGITEWCQY